MDQRPRRSVFERLGRLPREYSTNLPGSSSTGTSQALLGPGPAPLLRYPERSTHDLGLFNQRNPRRRPNPGYEDHYGAMKKSRMELASLEKPLQPILQLRQMPLIQVQPEKKKKLRLKRRKPRPVDETLDEGEIVDDDDDEEDEYEEYSDEEDGNDDLEAGKDGDAKNKSDERRPGLLSIGKECDTLSLKSFDSSSDKPAHKLSLKTSSTLQVNNNGSSAVNSNNNINKNDKIHGELQSDKGSNYSDWSDDEILLREDALREHVAKKDGHVEGYKQHNHISTDNDTDLVMLQNSGSQHKIQELEAISDDDFDAYDQDLLERNKDCVEEMLMNELVVTNDVSINDILSIDWKSLLPSSSASSATVTDAAGTSTSTQSDNEHDSTIQRRSSTETRLKNSKSCLEMLNLIGHSTALAGSDLSLRIQQTLRQQLLDDYIEQIDALAFLHHCRSRKIFDSKEVPTPKDAEESLVNSAS